MLLPVALEASQLGESASSIRTPTFFSIPTPQYTRLGKLGFRLLSQYTFLNVFAATVPPTLAHHLSLSVDCGGRLDSTAARNSNGLGFRSVWVALEIQKEEARDGGSKGEEAWGWMVVTGSGWG